MRESFLPFHLPDLGREEIESVTRVLESPWITSGPRVQELESKFAETVGAKHALAVNSCTAALHLALDAIGLKEGDEVLVPTMTFTATAETVLYFKARPILVDCDRDTLNIDVRDLERKMTSKTKAIMPVHVAGLPCAMADIREFAQVKKLSVIEDAAHAFPTRYKGKMVGSISDFTCFSFYATKTITTGEGGMVTTDHDEAAARIKMMRLHGLNRDAWRRESSLDSWFYEVVQPGFKYNLTDIAAAIGLPQLKKAESFRLKRERIAQKYLEAFKSCSAFLLPEVGAKEDLHSWHLFTLRLQPENLTITRNQFLQELKKRNIGTSVHWIPLHLHPFYRDQLGYRTDDFPNATWAADRIFSLPIYSKMTDRDVDDVTDAVLSVATTFRR